MPPTKLNPRQVAGLPEALEILERLRSKIERPDRITALEFPPELGMAALGLVFARSLAQLFPDAPVIETLQQQGAAVHHELRSTDEPIVAAALSSFLTALYDPKFFPPKE